MNITLIGMPGAGKTTIGKKLAKTLDFTFFDSDRIIEKTAKMSLAEIIDFCGEPALLDLETKSIVGLGDIKSHVLCPGGSVVYSSEAMVFLKNQSVVVFLDTELETIKARILDIAKRGIIGFNDKSWEDLYAQRLPLYLKYADIIVRLSAGLSADQIVERIIREISIRSNSDNVNSDCG